VTRVSRRNGDAVSNERHHLLHDLNVQFDAHPPVKHQEHSAAGLHGRLQEWNLPTMDDDVIGLEGTHELNRISHCHPRM
jgi:hypothetical protein